MNTDRILTIMYAFMGTTLLFAILALVVVMLAARKASAKPHTVQAAQAVTHDTEQ